MTTAYPGDASFEWKGINGAKAFQLQITKVSDSKKFKKPIVNETKFYSYLGTYTNSKKIKAGAVKSKNTSYTLKKFKKKKLKKNTMYYISVKPVCKVGKKNCSTTVYVSNPTSVFYSK